MASINAENAKKIRDPIQVAVTLRSADAEDITTATWNATNKQLTIPSGVTTKPRVCFKANSATEYVMVYATTPRGPYYPDASGNIIINYSSRYTHYVTFYGDGAALADTDTITLTGGLNLELDSKTLTNCTLALRSDLTLVNPSWQTSEINIGFYAKHLNASTLQYIATVINGAAITYQASYGDSTDAEDTTRYFYCTEEGLTVRDGEISLTGEDASALLNGTQKPRYFTFSPRAGWNRMYALFRSFITNAGITLVDVETAPEVDSGTQTGEDCEIYMDEKTYGEYVLYFMRYMCDTYFWPRYVDAGRPTVTWSMPTAKWAISASECGEIVRSYEPIISTLQIYDDSVQCSTTRRTIDTITEAEVGGIYTFEMEDPHRSFTVTNADIISSNPIRVVVKCTTAGTITLKGLQINQLQPDAQPWDMSIMYQPSYGITAVVNGEWFFLGANQEDDDGDYSIDMQYDVFQNNTNEKMSFVWKGDPRMQPLDVFVFTDLDGTSDAYTIESITLDHTGGGMSAEITARKGVI